MATAKPKALPGPDSSSPIIIGDKIFVTCWSGYADGTGDDMTKMVRHLDCISKAEGKIIWDKTVPAVQPEDFASSMLMEQGYASSTPVSDGSSVFVFFGKSGALAFDMEGKRLWQTSVGTNSNRKGWGSASSPILYKDTVIIAIISIYLWWPQRNDLVRQVRIIQAAQPALAEIMVWGK